MQFSGFRLGALHRLFFVPPLCLLIVVSFWSSLSMRLNPSPHDSLAQDVQCFTCFESPSPTPMLRKKPSLANFPSTTAYIKEVFLRNNFLKVEDSRVEYPSLTQPFPRLVTEQKEVLGEYPPAPFVPDEVPLDKSRDSGSTSTPNLSNSASAVMREEVVLLPPSKESMKGGHREVLTKGDGMIIPETERWKKGKYVETAPDRAPHQFRIKHSRSKLRGNYAMDVTVTSNATSIRKSYLSAGTEERGKGIRDSATIARPNVSEGVVSRTDKARFSPHRRGNRSSKLSRKVHIAPPNVTVYSIDLLAGTSDDERQWALGVSKILAGIRSSSPSHSLQTSSPSERKDGESCDGKYVYVYDLPSKFNVGLVEQCETILPWYSMCEFFLNEGFGRTVSEAEHYREGAEVLVPHGSWHETNQYALELVFHARMKAYRCLTKDPDEATLLYVPYYGGLDVLRWHFRYNLTKGTHDQLTFELLEWLDGQASWNKNGGKDHLLVLGKISWDFRRKDDVDMWGSKLLLLEPTLPTTKLLIERDPWHENDIGVPHPTFFHPKSDDDIQTWLSHVDNSERPSLVSFAGMPRPNNNGSIRGNLIEQCLKNSAKCNLLKCENTVCSRPEYTMSLFLQSHFCMQPPGDSPTRRSVFDSIIAGCIPVLFDPFTAYYQYPWHLPEDPASFSVYIPAKDIMNGRADVVEILSSISLEQRNLMRRMIIREVIPGLLYSQPGVKLSNFRDAFDISIDNLLERMPNLLSAVPS